MPRLSLGLGVQTTRKIGGGAAPFSPADLSGLSLWLKADAGTTTEAEQFISQIIFSGAGTTTSNGTYTRASGGTTGFTGPNGNTMNFDIKEAGGFVFQISDATFEDITYNVVIANDEITAITLVNGESPAPTATTSLTATGNTIVTAWADQSGNGNNASSIFPPALVSNILNSKPVLRFNGAWQQMNLTSSIGGTAYTILIVCKNNDNVNGSMFFWTTDNAYERYIASITSASYNASARNKFILAENDAGGGEGEESIIAWSSTAVNNNYFIGTAIQNGGGKAYSNGSGGTGSLGTFSASNTFNLIGGYGFGYELDGDVAEIIAYNRAVNSTERQQVEAYLNTKYAIY
jgi:hypothetical protein